MVGMVLIVAPLVGLVGELAPAKAMGPPWVLVGLVFHQLGVWFYTIGVRACTSLVLSFGVLQVLDGFWANWAPGHKKWAVGPRTVGPRTIGPNCLGPNLPRTTRCGVAPIVGVVVHH